MIEVTRIPNSHGCSVRSLLLLFKKKQPMVLFFLIVALLLLFVLLSLFGFTTITFDMTKNTIMKWKMIMIQHQHQQLSPTLLLFCNGFQMLNVPSSSSSSIASILRRRSMNSNPNTDNNNNDNSNNQKNLPKFSPSKTVTTNQMVLLFPEFVRATATSEKTINTGSTERMNMSPLSLSNRGTQSQSSSVVALAAVVAATTSSSSSLSSSSSSSSTAADASTDVHCMDSNAFLNRSILTKYEIQQEQEQQQQQPRPNKIQKRRKQQQSNVYKHLYRNYADISFDSFVRCMGPIEFLQSIGFNALEMDQLLQLCPSIVHQSVHETIGPKVRFLIETLDGGYGKFMWDDDDDNDDDNDEDVGGGGDGGGDGSHHHHHKSDYHSHHSMQMFETTKQFLLNTNYCRKRMNTIHYLQSNQYRIDRFIGPRHSYLLYHNLPSGNVLLQQPERLCDFLHTCASGTTKQCTQQFVELCNEWEQEKYSTTTSTTTSTNHDNNDNNNNNNNNNINHEQSLSDYKNTYTMKHHTIEGVQEFEQQFGLGLIAAVKKKHSSTTHVEVSSIDMIHLLLKHGANSFETDPYSGLIPLQWVAGTGNLEAVQILLDSMITESTSSAVTTATNNNPATARRILVNEFGHDKNGATAFHWACCGITIQSRTNSTPAMIKIGTGGSYDVCQYLLKRTSSSALSFLQQQQQQQQSHEPKNLVHTKTWSGDTPLMWAAWAGSGIPLLDLLLTNSGDGSTYCKEHNRYNQTVAHYATAGGNLEVCQYIYKLYGEQVGVDFWKTSYDIYNKTPFMYAEEYNRTDIIKWITQLEQ